MDKIVPNASESEKDEKNAKGYITLKRDLSLCPWTPSHDKQSWQQDKQTKYSQVSLAAKGKHILTFLRHAVQWVTHD